MPTFNLLYFKHLLDYSIIKFFDHYNDQFKKIDNKYVFSKNIDTLQIINFFRQSIIDKIKQNVVTYNRLKPNYYFIIGSCLPKDNLLLEFKNNNYFPKKLNIFLNEKQSIKYILKEKDIDIDIYKFNIICNKLFNEFFVKNILIKKLNDDYKNVFFIQHNRLDCYTMFKVIKYLYGKSNCINMYKEKLSQEKLPLTAINEIVKKYVNCSELNKSQQLKLITKEVNQYINERIKNL